MWDIVAQLSLPEASIRGELPMLQSLRQAWWAPLAGVLVVAELWLALVFVVGRGTSNLLDVEDAAGGTLLALAGAAALAVGLWRRPAERRLGSALIVVGAALAAIWFWTIVMTPIALVVIVGVVISEVRAATPTPA